MHPTGAAQKATDAAEPSAPAPADPDAALDLVALVDRYQTPLLRYVTKLIGYPLDDCEDVVQDTFLRLHRQLHEQGPGSIGAVRTWLFRVAHNLAMDVGRKRTRHKDARDGVVQHTIDRHEADDEPNGLIDALAQHEARTAAMTELDNLPDALRQVVLLKIVEGLTMRQIADVLQMSASNVCYRYNQALAELSTRLKEKGII